MKLIHYNPFRVAGILSNASERELQRQRTRIKAFAKVGKEIDSEYDFHILEDIARTEDSVNKAFSNIQQNQDKINHALFWFISASPFDKTALEYLKKGHIEKSGEIWKKVTVDKDVNSKNFSAFNNLGTLKLLSKIKSDIKEGIEAKIKLIESDYFKNFVQSIADETFSVDNQKQTKSLIDELLPQFIKQYSSTETFQLFSGCNGITQKYLSQKFTDEPLHRIESKIEASKKKRKTNKIEAYENGKKLFSNTKEDLSLLNSLLGERDLKYKAIADQLANEIMQCGIDYFNECQENNSKENYLKSTQELTKLGRKIAVGKLTKDRANDSLSSLEEMKDREITQAVTLLKSVKNAYDKNELNIRQQIKELEENDIELKYGLKTINYSAVEDNIRNSIDWSQVNNLLRDLFSDSNLYKIKESNKNKEKNEFWELANWLKEHSLNSSIISAIINKYKGIPPKLCFEILSAEITNTDSKSNIINKPFYVEDIRYVGLKLNISSTGNQKVTIYKRYINPEGKYKSSSKSSPIGYTSSKEITIRPETEIISLGGWGNGKDCTYQVGEHKIEIYIDHYKIFTKTFNVAWSPKRTSEITDNLSLLQTKLEEVQKFKWFRGSESKRNEINEIQEKINRTRKILKNK